MPGTVGAIASGAVFDRQKSDTGSKALRVEGTYYNPLVLEVTLMSCYTKSEIQSMSIDQIMFTHDYPDTYFAIRQTQYCDNVLVFRSANASYLRMLAVRVNYILSVYVKGYKEYSTEVRQQPDGLLYVVVPLKTQGKNNLPVSIVDKIVTNLVGALGKTCHAETSDGVEPNSPCEQGPDLHTTVDVEVVSEIPDTAIAIREPLQLNAGGKQKQATVAQLRKHLGVKGGTKSELLAQLR